MENIIRKCSICRIPKPLCEFGKDASMKYGHKYVCLECRHNKVVKIKEIVPDGFKKCACCKDIKKFIEFNIDKHTKTGLASYCKKCNKEKCFIKYRKKHVLKIKEILPEGLKRCGKCKKIKLVEEFGSDKRKKSGLKCYCKKCRGIDYSKEKRRKYINKWANEYNKKNPHIIAWRNLLKHSLKRLGKRKENCTSKLLGYSAIELKKYIEALFTEGMSWNNYGEWHIDHIKAVSKFDKDTPPSVVNSLNNLQPLWATNRWINGVFYLGNLNKNNK
jgi:hypothetical protein